MKAEIIINLIGLLIKQLKPEHVGALCGGLLDKAEEIVKDSSNTIDDALLLPIIEVARQGLGLDD